MSQQAKLLDLKPAEICITTRPAIISTVLGSCVAICLFGGAPGTGAMSHSLLPTGSVNGGPDIGRFVDESLDMMLFRLGRLGLSPPGLRAKLFGGSDMFGLEDGRLKRLTVGRQNVEMARRLLAAKGIPLVAEDTGGPLGRKIFFSTLSGEVLVKLLGNKQLSNAA